MICQRTRSISWRRPGRWVCAWLLMIAALTASADQGWPRAFSADDGSKLLVYQPQLEDWQDYSELVARAAFELQLADSAEQILGAIKVKASTGADLENRLVVLDEIQISDTSFPGLAKARVAKAEAALRGLFPTNTVTVELDRLLANLDREQVKVRIVEAAVKAPRLLISERDAVLVLIDGEPLLEPVEDTDLMVVINTPSDLFWHKRRGAYYLRVDRGWLTSFKPEDGWVPLNSLPDEFGKIPDTPGWSKVRAALPGDAFREGDAPSVFLSTEPAALLVFDGQPKLTQIPETELLFATNTEGDVFLDSSISGDFYVLLAGRWFRASTLQSPLEYAGDDLPSDFAKIPPDHPAGRVLASVPGTQQAQEAVLGAQIPTKVTVARSEASVGVSYEGDPVFESIPGTEVEYAANTSLDVFRIANRYFVCYEGVWFSSDGPLGPWSLIDEIPSAISTIPPTSPKYHVTHTYIYKSTDDYVETGYDAGYLGAFVVGAVLVYGITNADYVHVRACSGYCRPYYRHHHRWYRTQPVRHRHRHHHRHRHVFRHQVYGHGRHYDHLSGRYAHTAEVRRHQSIGAVYSSPGTDRRVGTAGSTAVARGNRQAAIAANTIIRERPATRDIYSGRDGRLYKRENGGWSRYENGRWQNQTNTPQQTVGQPAVTKRPAASSPRSETPRPASAPASLGSAVRARTDGASRSGQFKNYRQSRAPIFKRGSGGGPRPGRRR